MLVLRPVAATAAAAAATVVIAPAHGPTAAAAAAAAAATAAAAVRIARSFPWAEAELREEAQRQGGSHVVPPRQPPPPGVEPSMIGAEHGGRGPRVGAEGEFGAVGGAE